MKNKRKQVEFFPTICFTWYATIVRYRFDNIEATYDIFQVRKIEKIIREKSEK